MSTSDESADWTWPSAHRQVRQRLEALKRSGVEHIPQIGAAERRQRLAALGIGTVEGRPPAESVAQLPESTTRVAPGLEEPVPDVPVVVEPARPEPRPLPPAIEARPVARRVSSQSLFEKSKPAEDLGPAVPAADRPAALEVIAQEVAGCMRCPVLVENRTKTVPGEGNPSARLVFMGEAPGADEDRTGRPFVGRAGQLLTDMITKGMGIRREDVFILNTIKCRPPQNRAPTSDEQANCRGYLDRQLAILRPEFLCLLGKTAAVAILGLEPTASMAQSRGKWFEYQGIRTILTYHPAYLLRNPAAKKDTWEDLKFLMKAMGIEPPRRG